MSGVGRCSGTARPWASSLNARLIRPAASNLWTSVCIRGNKKRPPHMAG